MFTRFTEKARLAVVTAQEEARKQKRHEISAGHLTLGIAATTDSLALKALAAQGVSADQLRAAALASLGDSTGEDEPKTMIPFDASAKKVLELTVREALRLGHNYVGTEHILLALINQDDAFFSELGVDAATTEAYFSAALESLKP